VSTEGTLKPRQQLRRLEVVNKLPSNDTLQQLRQYRQISRPIGPGVGEIEVDLLQQRRDVVQLESSRLDAKSQRLIEQLDEER